MTSLDHLVETVLWVHCTSCKRLYEATLLMPIVTKQDRMMMLCGLCQWTMKPKEDVCCRGMD